MTTPQQELSRMIVILASHADPAQATRNLQHHLNLIQERIHKWKIKINEAKSTQVIFKFRRELCPPVWLNDHNIPESPSVKYLGIHLYSKLTWKDHVTKKRNQIDLRTQEVTWLIGRRSNLSLDNKVLLYKTIMKPIWVYGFELWGCASTSNISIIQRRQSKILRQITDAPWYVNNQTIHTDFNIPYITDVVKEKSTTHHKKLARHSNDILQPLVEPQRHSRLRGTWLADLKQN
jgi:hypothetical protein